MSILNTLALMMAAIAARPPKIDTPDVEATRLKAQIDDLTRERDQALVEADHWRLLAQRWQARYETALHWQTLTQANQIQQGAMLPQQSAQTCAQLAQNLAPYNRLTNLGAQNLDQNFEQFCNCVPARHDLLLNQRVRARTIRPVQYP